MNNIMIGYSERDITPNLGVGLSGYGFYLDRKAKGVLDPLKVRTIVVKNKETEICLISCDLIGLSIEFCDLIAGKIHQETGIGEESILISCTHTHSSPVTSDWTGDIFGSLDKEYLESVGFHIVNSVVEAKNNLQYAEMGFAIEKIQPIGYNRVIREDSPVDDSLSVIVFRTEQNKKLFLINYACHPVTLGINYEISADFPGRVIEAIESTPANKGIFFQGCCGDIDPLTHKVKWGSGTVKDIICYGEHICRETIRITEAIPYTQDIEIKSTKKRIKLPLNVPTLEEIKNIKILRDKRFHEEWTKKAIGTIQSKEFSNYIENVPIQGIKLGDIVMIGLPGEVFTEIGLRIKQFYKNTIVVGYANGVVGYIPTTKTYENENDYACYLACRVYPHLFPFCKEIEEVIVEEAKEVLRFGARS